MTDAAGDTRATVAPTRDVGRELSRDHPLEESKKSYHIILEQQIGDATRELRRPASGLLLSGLAAGLDLGFGPFAMAIALTQLQDVLPRPIVQMLMANLYAIGFIFVVIGRSALFTEHTTLAVQPVLARRASLRQLGRLWGLVLIANVVGAALFALFAVTLGRGLGMVEIAAFGEIARPLVDKPAGIMLLSGVAAGWLMGLLAWLASAVRDTISQIIVVWLTTMLIAYAHLHHSIAGSVEVLMGVFAGVGATPYDFFRFLLWAVVGNAIGGALFVAVLKFASVARSRE